MTATELQQQLDRLGAVRCGSAVTAPCPLCQREPVPVEKHHLSITAGSYYSLCFFCHKCQIPKPHSQEERDHNRTVSKQILDAAGCDTDLCFQRMDAGEIRRLWSQVALGSVVLEEDQERQPDRVLSVAYNELLDSLHLSEKHSKWLVKRGMDPHYCYSISYRSAEGECDSEREWVGVPGCVGGKWLLRPSLLIPCRNRDGLICAIKQRVTDGGKARMRLLSHRGIRARQLVHWPLNWNDYNTNQLWITEGERKADYLCNTSLAAVGLPGCGSWQRVVPLIEEWEAVVLALDMDEAGRKTTDLLGRLLKASGKQVQVAKWDRGKGADDALAAGEELRLEEFVAAQPEGEAETKPTQPPTKGSLRYGQPLSDHQIVEYLRQFGPQPMHLVKAYPQTVVALLREGRLSSRLTKEGRILEVVE